MPLSFISKISILLLACVAEQAGLPGRKPRGQVFSQRGSSMFDTYKGKQSYEKKSFWKYERQLRILRLAVVAI